MNIEEQIGKEMFLLQSIKDRIIAFEDNPHKNVQKAVEVILKELRSKFSLICRAIALVLSDEELKEFVEWYRERWELDLTFNELKYGVVGGGSTKRITDLL